MQKRNYQQFRDEQETEMANYQPSIPVGLPVPPSYAQAPLQQHYAPQPQYVPEPQQYAQQPQFAALPPPAFAPALVAPPLNGQNYGYPVQVTCPCCRASVPTVVNQESGNTTYMWCAFIGCCVSPLCCCVPFLMDSCLDKTHYCPNCGHTVLRKHQRCFEFLGC